MSQDSISPDDLDLNTDEAWVSVIQKMDEAYADLVHSQVEVEAKNAELEEAKTFLDSVQGSMSDVLIVCDNQGLILEVNEALERVTGQSSAQLHGQSLAGLVSENYRAKLQTFDQQLRVQPVRDCEVELLARDGSAHPMSMNCTPRKNHRGRIVGMVLVGRPLGELHKAYNELNAAHAELKLAQEQLVQAEKMASLGRLVAGVAHELNNPISFVYGNMHALQRYTERLVAYFDAVLEGRTREELRELRAELRIDKVVRDLNSLVDGTMEGADRVREIVHDLRQFSSTQEAEKTKFDLTHVTRSALHWITKESKRKIEVIDNMPQHQAALGHTGQIHQVVVNLIQNASDAMAESEQPRLEISAGEALDHCWLEVHDNGSGVPEGFLSRLFDPFFTTKPVGQGTGLGLSISYGIVSEHGGELSINNHPDGGAVARLRLPKE